ncbi:type II secretion system protein [Sulfurovum sp. CS9]|uniref:type II secretion system protein n=1 Tax=Sulfurovum sp. CS9 TaxID=3391146 RepID=UPI0039EAB1FC
MHKHKKPAFTMIEVVFVIVILGIVASIGSSLIVKTYESYILQRALHRVSLSTELAAMQLVNRLTFRIDKTTVARRPAAPYDFITVSSISSNGDDIHTALEWISYDDDSFSATLTPGWSGYADVIDPGNSRAAFATPGSNLGSASTIIGNLSDATVSLTGGGGDRPAIFFNADEYRDGNTTSSYGAGCMGLDYATNDTSCILAVSGTVNAGAADILNFTDAAHTGRTKTIYEHYKLAWSAYAVVPVLIPNTTLYELRLYYNYQPWQGEEYTGAPYATLLRNVSVFKFSESGGTVRLKLCAQQNIAGTKNVTICKEKAIIR